MKYEARLHFHSKRHHISQLISLKIVPTAIKRSMKDCLHFHSRRHHESQLISLNIVPTAIKSGGKNKQSCDISWNVNIGWRIKLCYCVIQHCLCKKYWGKEGYIWLGAIIPMVPKRPSQKSMARKLQILKRKWAQRIQLYD